MPNEDQIQTGVSGRFLETLNRHGYSFQYSLLKAILGRQHLFQWGQPLPEFPVGSVKKSTRIDFVLRYKGSGLLMAAECKRVNPAMGNWCFAARPDYELGVLERGYYVERLRTRDGQVIADHIEYAGRQPRFHVGVEVKTGERGNSSGPSGRDAIETACTQAMVGLNGLVEFFSQRREFWVREGAVGLVPVIFTTANLWVTTAEIDAASIETGNLDLERLPVERVPWMLYHYHQSPALKHNLPSVSSSASSSSGLADILYRDYVRPILIVSPSGLEAFLDWDAWEMLRIKLN